MAHRPETGTLELPQLPDLDAITEQATKHLAYWKVQSEKARPALRFLYARSKGACAAYDHG